MTPLTDRAEPAIEALADAFLARFPARPPRRRLVGREAEFPIVDGGGRAGDHAAIWPALLEATGGRPLTDPAVPLIGVLTPTWFCIAEVGRGTIEVGVGPRASLQELDADLAQALGVIVPVVRQAGFHILGYGIQPRTPPRASLMTPKARYQALVDAIGHGWVRWTVTASDQVHVDVGRTDVVRAMNVVNALSGAIVALTANSSVIAGRTGANASSREALSARVSGEPFRNGAVPRAFADAADYVRWTSGFRALVLPDGRGGFARPGRTYAELLAGRRGAPDLDEWLYHEHYVWPSGRPRARLATIEVRPACQQPDASAAAAAVSAGLVEAADEAEAWLGSEHLLDPEGWRRLLRYRRDAVRRGMHATEPLAGFLATVVDLAATGLARRGLDEDRLLDPIRERLARGSGPADRARALFARGGIPALVRGLTLDR